jgi:hypothetical protein
MEPLKLAARSVMFGMLAVVFLGCKKAPLESLPVKGKVTTSSGRSLEGFKITFWPQSPDVKRVASDLLKADGSFSLECPKGTYKVTLVPPGGPTTGVGGGASNSALPSPKQDHPAVPAAYQDSTKTPWTVDVLAADNDKIVLAIQ